MNGLSDDDVEFLKDILGPEESEDEFLPPPRPSPIKVRISPSPSLQSPPRSPSVGSGSLLRLAPSHQRSASRVGGPLRKCEQVCLGGTKIPIGMTSDVKDPHFCSNLFCISCDHIVIRFADRRWSKATDYLFLRNNYPDKVGQNLVFAPGWCAYCCQCTFCEEENVKKLAPYSTNWVCRGHH